ncbi:MAG TPA: CopG family antitoxin [Methylococcaceae bacterium]|nr:CopG family antitoxin [Methylococcaceae bacterium]
MKASDFDRRFDEGEDVTDFLDLKKARRPGLEQKRVNVDFPAWMVQSLDKEAMRLGVTRQALIKLWLADRLERRESG